MAHARQAPTTPTTLSERKLSSVSTNGLQIHGPTLVRKGRTKSIDKDLEDDEKEVASKCGSPFCRQILTNRYARFCEDKAMCQRYRALHLQCRANAQDKDKEENRSLVSLVSNQQKNVEKKKEIKAAELPKKLVKIFHKKGVDLRMAQKKSDKRLKTYQYQEVGHDVEKERKKRRKRAVKDTGGEEAVDASMSIQSANVAPLASLVEAAKHTDVLKRKRLKLQTLRTRLTAALSSDTDSESTDQKRRRLPHASVKDTPSFASTVAVEETWKIPRAKPKTAAQAIKHMNVEPVPLGVASHSGKGGGRYIHNGNVSAARSLTPSIVRAKPRTMTKVVSPVAALAPPSVLSRPGKKAQVTVPARPSPLKQQLRLPGSPFTPLSTPPAPRPTRLVIPSPLAERKSAVERTWSATPARSITPTSGASSVRRISAADYLRSKKNDTPGQPHEELFDHRPARSPSLDSSLGFPASANSLPRYRSSHSASFSSYRESGSSGDFRRQYLEASARYQCSGVDEASSRMECQSRLKGYAELFPIDRMLATPREVCKSSRYEPRYEPRFQDPGPASISHGRYDYVSGLHHFSPLSSPTEQTLYRRKPLREQLTPPLQRTESPRNSDVECAMSDQQILDDADLTPPSFSYHEDFLPRMLYVFIHVLPQSLEAVFNITKKPRKMNWYLKYVERIERLCKPFDLHIKIKDLKATISIRGREWRTLQSPSTVALHVEIIKTVRAEAVTWRRLHEEMEQSLAFYRTKFGDRADQSYIFLRAWNDLKTPQSDISLSRQANFVCGARLYHWNFVVGSVEIGSGSHEEKRQAFRLATMNGLHFVLACGRGMPHPAQAVRPYAEESSGTSRDGRDARLASPVRNTGRASSPSDEGHRVITASAAPPSTDEFTDRVETKPLAKALVTTQPRSPAMLKKSLVSVERPKKSESNHYNVSHERGTAAEREASNLEMVMLRGSPPLTTHTPPHSVASLDSVASADLQAALPLPPTSRTAISTAALTDHSFTSSRASIAPVGSSESPAKLVNTIVSDSTSKTIPASQTKTKEALPRRQCMMCEMIRLRRPNGERCLRCQKKGSPARMMLNESLGV